MKADLEPEPILAGSNSELRTSFHMFYTVFSLLSQQFQDLDTVVFI